MGSNRDQGGRSRATGLSLAGIRAAPADRASRFGEVFGLEHSPTGEWLWTLVPWGDGCPVILLLLDVREASQPSGVNALDLEIMCDVSGLFEHRRGRAILVDR